MRGVLTISLVAWRESIRSKLFAGLILFIGVILLFSLYVSSLSVGEVARYIQNTGLLGMSVICLAVAILFGLFSLYQEKDRNELYVLLNRVPRSSYLLGRFLGTVYVIVLFSFFAGAGVFFLVWIFGHKIVFGLLWAVYWSVLEFSLVTAVGLLFYTLGVGFTLNSLLVLCVYVLGHSMTEGMQSFIGLGRFGSKTHLFLVKAVTLIFPNFDLFDFRLAILHDEALPWGKVLLSSGYGLLYLVAVLAAAAAVMNRRDT